MDRNSRDPAHVLMPAEIAHWLPPLYATENAADPIAYVKLFTPDSSFTWYVVEYDPEQRLCFGLVVGRERELGYFSLTELEALRGPLGLPVERDLSWQSERISKCS